MRWYSAFHYNNEYLNDNPRHIVGWLQYWEIQFLFSVLEKEVILLQFFVAWSMVFHILGPLYIILWDILALLLRWINGSFLCLDWWSFWFLVKKELRLSGRVSWYYLYIILLISIWCRSLNFIILIFLNIGSVWAL